MELWEMHDTRQGLRMAVFVSFAWAFALVTPPALVGYLPRPNTALWIMMAILYTYLGYSGLRALRKGWRSRFILRVVVPLSLLAFSSLLTSLAFLAGARPSR